MRLKDYHAQLHNDLPVSDASAYTKHANLIKNKNYTAASSLLADADICGAKASLFNSWENAVFSLVQLSQAVSWEDPYCHSAAEPPIEMMDGKTIWQQEY